MSNTAPKHEGRSTRGTFTKGNSGNKQGNPGAKVDKARAAMLRAVKAGEIRDICRRVINAALKGEKWAIEMFFDRSIGRPSTSETKREIEQLEKRVAEALEKVGQ